jgi:hypothetical protein
VVDQVGNGNSVQYLTMIWTCANGGSVWIDYLGRPLYCYIDGQNGTGEVGMTLAWTDVQQGWQGWCYLRVYGTTLTFRIP